ncbi:ANKUB1-like, partial [Paramuricea clavata]
LNLSRRIQCFSDKRLLKHLLKMRVFVSFQETVHSLDVDVRETVRDIKNALRERFGLNLKNHRNETDQFVSLVYQGSSLQDSWVYSDLGIPPGSTLVCCVEKQVEPTLIVHCINYDEKIEYKQNFNVWDTLVGTLRGMIQDSAGIPVSAFRLYSESGLELFDCHPLKVYGVDTGDTVTMEIWRDVADTVHAARDNDITDTLDSLASFQDGPHLMRYQLQLGLFTAAHYGYHQLATQLMKCGAKPDEPVGQHPSRDWCRASAHVDHVKTPAHEAAQHGRLKCLQHFLMFNYAVLICKDAHGLTPCNIARRHKQTECFKLLVAEQFRIPSVHPELSIHVYSRVRKWCNRARMRARVHKDKTAMLLLTNAEVAQKCAVVGQRVEVDGFNGLGKSDRKIKSAPSSLNTSNEKITVDPKSRSATSRGNLPTSQSNTSKKKIHISSKSHSFSQMQIQRTKSDVSFQGNSKAYHSNNTFSSNLHDASYMNRKSYYDKSKRQNSNIRQKNPELYGRPKTKSAGHAYSVTGLNATPGKKEPLTSSFVTPRMSRADHTTSRDSTRGEHDVPLAGETHREPTLTELGESGKRPNSRYIWKSLDDVVTDNQENRRIPMDKRSQTRTPVNDDQRDPVKSNDSPNNSGEISGFTGSTLGNTGEKQDGRPVFSRGKIGECRQEVTSSINRQSLASITREAYNTRKVVATLKSGATQSNAEKCLRVASETFRKKSWLGQLQMALVVNTNMCKRRPQADKVPGGEDKVPDAQDKVPCGEDKVPGGEDKVPGGEDKVPGGEDKVPGGEDNVHGGEGKITGGEDKAPGAEDKVPGGEDNVPGGQDNVPDGEDKVPGGEDNVPGAEDKVPGGEDNVPGGQDNVPDGEDKVPGGEDNVPGAEDKVPGGEDNVPG